MPSAFCVEKCIERQDPGYEDWIGWIYIEVLLLRGGVGGRGGGKPGDLS